MGHENHIHTNNLLQSQTEENHRHVLITKFQDKNQLHEDKLLDNYQKDKSQILEVLVEDRSPNQIHLRQPPCLQVDLSLLDVDNHPVEKHLTLLLMNLKLDNPHLGVHLLEQQHLQEILQ